MTEPDTIDLALPPSLTPVGRDFVAYWHSLRAGQFLPDREDIDPGAIKHLLPFLVIHDLVAPDRIELRLVGTAVAEDYGTDITGWNYLDMVETGRRDKASESFFMLHNHPVGMTVTLRATTRSGSSWLRQTVDLPISDIRHNRKLVISCSLRADQGRQAETVNASLQVQSVAHRELIDIGAGIPDIVN